jgi:putative membrane protein
VELAGHAGGAEEGLTAMNAVANGLVVLVALEHVWFMALEMFLWTKPVGLRTFRQTEEKARSSAALAANQGLYNGFLAAGLLWGVWLGSAGYSFKVFFLGCVVVAGLYGAATSSKKILFVQAIPGALALALVLVAG